METKHMAGNRMVSRMGAILFVSWLLFLGPVGFVLLLVVAYAMAFQNLALGLLAGLALVTPVVVLAAWGALWCHDYLMEKWVMGPAVEAARETVSAD